MSIHLDKAQEDKNKLVSTTDYKIQGNGESTFQFVDNRSRTTVQKKLQEMIHNSSQVEKTTQLQKTANNYTIVQQPVIQKKENNTTGLSDNLKTGIENLSGYSLDDVKVHYNSDKPAQLQAHAYAQGTDIHVAAGQEKHVPHEAWHVVQQKQGRVKPTTQLKGKVQINDDQYLEKEADIMGAKALQNASISSQNNLISSNKSLHSKPILRKSIVIQRFADTKAADDWITNELLTYNITPKRTSRMKPAIDEFKEQLDGWKQWGDAWIPGVIEKKGKVEKYYKRVQFLEKFEDEMQPRFGAYNATNSSLKTTGADMANVGWLHSYATNPERLRMTAISDNLTPSSDSYDNYLAALNAVMQKINNIAIADIYSKADKDKFLQDRKAEIDAIMPVTGHDNALLAEGQNLSQTLKDNAKVEIKALLQAAKDDNDKKLNLDDKQINSIVSDQFDAKLSKPQVQARIAGAINIQHKPSKDIWLKKVLGMSESHGGAYIRNNTGVIDGIGTHATRYDEKISDNPSVTSGSAELKNNILGSGDNGFHVTLETSQKSYSQPHAYRGGLIYLRWDKNGHEFKTLNSGQVRNAFATIRNNQVAAAEKRIDDKRDDKGKDIQKGAIIDKLQKG